MLTPPEPHCIDIWGLLAAMRDAHQIICWCAQDLRCAVILDGDVAPEAVQNESYNGEVWVSQLDAPSDAAQGRLSKGASWALAPFVAHQVGPVTCMCV